MSLQPCDSVSSPVEGTVFQLSTSETLLPLRPHIPLVGERDLFTVCDERIHACDGEAQLKNTSWLCRLQRREALSRGKRLVAEPHGHGHVGLGPLLPARAPRARR